MYSLAHYRLMSNCMKIYRTILKAKNLNGSSRKANITINPSKGLSKNLQNVHRLTRSECGKSNKMMFTITKVSSVSSSFSE